MAGTVNETPDANAYTVWFFALYGATMLSVQLVEHSVAFLYLVANTDPLKSSNASAKRQWSASMDRTWRAFQKGTAGMKLHDTKVGIKAHLDGDLYDELDAFITGPRNQLAHRYLLERVAHTEQGGLQSLAAAGGELLEIHQRADRLHKRLYRRAMEVMGTWPETSEPPDDVKQWLEDVGRVTMLKQFPAAMLNHARQARAEREAQRGQQADG